MFILWMKKQGLEKLKGFSEITQLLRGRAVILNPVHCN